MSEAIIVALIGAIAPIVVALVTRKTEPARETPPLAERRSVWGTAAISVMILIGVLAALWYAFMNDYEVRFEKEKGFPSAAKDSVFADCPWYREVVGGGVISKDGQLDKDFKVDSPGRITTLQLMAEDTIAKLRNDRDRSFVFDAKTKVLTRDVTEVLWTEDFENKATRQVTVIPFAVCQRKLFRPQKQTEPS